MKGLAKDIVTSFLLGVVVPAMVIRAGILLRLERQREIPLPSVSGASEARPPEPEPNTIFFLQEDGTGISVELEEYLVGAVLGEMPASFAPEALKAQAVAARTFAWKAHSSGGRHPEGDVCSDYACCQAYVSREEYLDRGGTLADVERIRAAVAATEGLVLTYEGELIEATYFSCSGGRTEDAVAVWGNDYPYLVSVESPGEEEARYHTDEVRFTREQLEALLGLTLPQDSGLWFGELTHTNGGGVQTLRIGTELFSGTMLRNILGLRSTAFSVEAQEDAALFVTRGYGHRVGMSQYGAEAMAAMGADYGEILRHYYPGTRLTAIE